MTRRLVLSRVNLVDVSPLAGVPDLTLFDCPRIKYIEALKNVPVLIVERCDNV